MTIFHCIVIEKTEGAHWEPQLGQIDMESVDYKRQPLTEKVSQCIVDSGGIKCGVVRGGLFGLATNQIWVFTAWKDSIGIDRYVQAVKDTTDYRIVSQQQFSSTVRPNGPEIIDRKGIYVIRHINMLASDIDEYTALCLETWPRFEASSASRCYGVFRPVNTESVITLLMLTWYRTFDDWEKSRQLDPADLAKWARRSEMELSHWAEVGRLDL